MNRILCLTFVMSVLASPALAGMSEGVAAATMGDYQRAISEFEPLATSGDAAAQYQLGKLYLEGHGPADGVARGVELMIKSAHGNHPEAQAHLGLMYAMGLGVPVDNAKAYEWLTKAVDALPDGTRRSVAVANRDAVKKRMGMGTVTTVAETSTETPPAAPAKPAKTETQAAATATKPAAAKTEATAAAPATTKPAATAKVEAKPAEAATTTKATTTTATTAKVEAKPAEKSAATAAATTKPAAKVTEASNTKPAKTPDTSTQVASAKAPDAAPAPGSKQPTGVRIQLISMPSEDAAWAAWKQLSGKYSTQLTGLTAMIETADLGTKGTFYRVQAGPFDNVAAAQERCTAMKQAGLDCLVVGKP